MSYLRKNNIKPFKIFKHDDNMYAVILYQSDYCYDWLQEEKVTPHYYGDGHCYNDAFYDYLEDNFSELNKRLEYDSENGMFCVYCQNKKDADKVAHELSLLYNDEIKMINLIKDTKKKYSYAFDVRI